MDDKCKIIADYYGYENQSLQAIEEMAELMVALRKFARREMDVNYRDQRSAILEEIADVEIIMEQLTYLLDGDGVVDSLKSSKIDRQLKRIGYESR